MRGFCTTGVTFQHWHFFLQYLCMATTWLKLRESCGHGKWTMVRVLFGCQDIPTEVLVGLLSVSKTNSENMFPSGFRGAASKSVTFRKRTIRNSHLTSRSDWPDVWRWERKQGSLIHYNYSRHFFLQLTCAQLCNKHFVTARRPQHFQSLRSRSEKVSVLVYRSSPKTMPTVGWRWDVISVSSSHTLSIHPSATASIWELLLSYNNITQPLSV